MSATSRHDNQPKLLFQVKEGTVTAEIRGPRIGWRYRRVTYFRWIRATTGDQGWLQVLPDREVDQLHLQRCVKAVRAWLKQEAALTKENFRPKH